MTTEERKKYPEQDNEEKEKAPFTVYYDNLEKNHLMYIQNTRLFTRNQDNKLEESVIVLCRYIGGRSAAFTLEEWNYVSVKSGKKRFEIWTP